MRPAAHLLFLRRQEKKAKEGDPQSATPALRYGANLGRGACGVRRITHCAPAALRSDKRGESVHEACARGRACHPASTPPQAQPEGGGQPKSQKPKAKKPNGPLLRSAQSAQRVALAPGRCGPSAAMARVGVRLRVPSGCAEERRFWRMRARVCLSVAKRREFSETPTKLSTAGCPQRSEGTQPAGSLFLGLLSFGEAKESESPAGARPGPRARQRHTTSYKNNSC